ncbi:uncharacterized protein LOC134532085 isoform X2 [Bacillus rossius redtenbacheri]
MEPCCDSDDEVFFGPMTMREVRVMFNLKDAPADGARCGRHQSPGHSPVKHPAGSEEGLDLFIVNGDQHRSEGDSSSDSHSCELLNNRLVASDLVVSQQEVGSRDDSSLQDMYRASVGSSGEVSSVACPSMRESSCETSERDARSISPADSSSDDLDDTFAMINKLLAQRDESLHTNTSAEDVSEQETRIPRVFAETQSSSEVCHHADATVRVLHNWTNGSNACIEDRNSTNFDDQSNGLVRPEQGCNGDECSEESSLSYKINQQLAVHHGLSEEESVGREFPQSPSKVFRDVGPRGNVSAVEACSLNNTIESRACVDDQGLFDGGVAGSTDTDGEDEVEVPARRAVFATPARPARKPQSPQARGRYVVQSPVGMYIRSNPTPVLVKNVRPSPCRGVQRGSNLDVSLKVPTPVTPVGSPLPVVRYTSQAACVLVSQQLPVRKLPPSVEKLIAVPEPIVTRHQGRFKVKAGPNVKDDVEVSFLVQTPAKRTPK